MLELIAAGAARSRCCSTSAAAPSTSRSRRLTRRIVIRIDSCRRAVYLAGDLRSHVGCRLPFRPEGAEDSLPRVSGISGNDTGARRRAAGKANSSLQVLSSAIPAGRHRGDAGAVRSGR